MRAAVLLALAGVVQLSSAHQSVNLEKYRLKSKSEYVKRSDVPPHHRLVARDGGYLETASQLVSDVAPELSVRLSPDHYVGTNGMGHVYYKQTVNGRDIDNAGFSVNVSILAVNKGPRLIDPDRQRWLRLLLQRLPLQGRDSPSTLG